MTPVSSNHTTADGAKLADLMEGELEQFLLDREQERRSAEIAASTAAQRRDAAIRELASRNVSNVHIAQLLGISGARVGQIVQRLLRAVP